MRQTGFITLVLCCVTALIAARTLPRFAVDDIGRNVTLIGRLGEPVGETITIKGRRMKAGVSGIEFVVSEVNGKPIEPTIVNVPGSRAWEHEIDITLRGREDVTIRFRRVRIDDEIERRQSAFVSFHTSEIVSPDGLKLGTDDP